MRCAEVLEVAAELVLDTLDGERRAAAVDHLASCSSCRADVEELARAAEALWLVAPEAEPPAGFESRVLRAIRARGGGAPARGRSRALVLRWVAAAAAAGLLVAGGAVVGAARSGGGTPVASGAMVDQAAARVGHAVVSGGDTAYVHVSVEGWAHDGEYLVEVIRRDGTHVAVAPIRLDAGRGAAGGRLPVPYRDVRAVWVTDAAHTEWCSFRL